MSPLRDTSVMFAGSFTGGCTSADLHVLSDALEMDGTPLHGLALMVTASSGTGTSPHLTIELYSSSSTTAPTTGSKCIAIRTGLELAEGGTAETYVSYIIPFDDPAARSLKCMVELTGSTATAALTVASVEVGIVENVGLEWDRNVSFH